MSRIAVFFCIGMLTAAIGVSALCLSYAADEAFPFQGRVHGEGINIRSDATTSAPVISTAASDQVLTVLSESYGWYKVVLPPYAPAYIKKTFVTPFGTQTVRVVADRVNIRLGPSESTPIIGHAKQNEVFSIAADQVGWYRIMPSQSCTGWVHAKFLAKVAPVPKTEPAVVADTAPQETLEVATETVKPVLTAPQDEAGAVTLEGIVESYGKVLHRVASHKLITQDKKTYLLQYDPAKLSSALYRKVKITGAVVDSQQKIPLVAVKSLEIVD